jgi:predicted ATP-grasp superfamily ATP-dependent carboligase
MRAYILLFVCVNAYVMCVEIKINQLCQEEKAMFVTLLVAFVRAGCVTMTKHPIR